MPDADRPCRSSELDEPALVDACLAERAGAFDLIVERHRRAVYQLCYRFVGNHEDASDLSQDVFLRAYRGLRSFRGQSSLATWLYRIGVNVCLNRVSAKDDARQADRADRGAAVRRRARRVAVGADAARTSARRACARRSRSCRASSARR